LRITAPVTQKLLTEAVTEFLVIKDHELEQDLLSEPYLTRVKRDLKRLQKHFPGATVAELTGARLLGISRPAGRRTRHSTTAGASSRPSLSSRSNGTGLLTTRSRKSRPGASGGGAGVPRPSPRLRRRNSGLQPDE
jgi:hypothetical protein